MPVLKIKQNGTWEEVSGISEHTHDEYASVEAFNNLQDKTEQMQEVVDRMNGILTENGIVLTEGIDYGSGDPVGGVLGQLYFKKVT
jgi:hypothetical protein